ncbi:MAG: hypothetical protein AB8H80_23055 [Planctomycetota bacterium]
MIHSLLATVLAALLALPAWSSAAAQDAQPSKPASQGPSKGEQTVRLTYELPVDALMRSLKNKPDQDLEQLLAQAVALLKQRLGPSAEVSRHAATGFQVVLPARSSHDTRRLIENVHAMEMRMLAYGDYARDGVTFNLEKESGRLSRWLAEQDLEQVRAKPDLMMDFQPMSPHLRWSLHRIEADGGRWGTRYGQRTTGKAPIAVVPLFTEEEFQRGPAAAGAPPHLLECVAINLHEQHFHQGDLKLSACTLGIGMSGGLAVNYELKRERKEAYSEFSFANRGRMCAILLQGQIASAPIFRGRIAGRGVIEGNFTQQQAERLVKTLRSGHLPAAPKLLQREVLPK